MEMAHLFAKSRCFHREGSAEYGYILVLQRLYNALTAPYPLTLPASGVPEPSPTLFASLPAGPGNARSLHETTQELRAGAAEEQVGFGITTYRVGTKDRVFTDEASQVTTSTLSIPMTLRARSSGKSLKLSSRRRDIEHII